MEEEDEVLLSHYLQLDLTRPIYAIGVSRNMFIDATHNRGFGRFINHYCQQNCILLLLGLTVDHYIVIMQTITYIYPGMEICAGYGWTYHSG